MRSSQRCSNPSHARIVGEGFCRICEKARREEEKNNSLQEEEE